MSSQSNKQMRKRRTMQYFIDAASKILTEEGIENLTTRNVATAAGYNSATIYNYFDNFERLIAFAAIKGLKDYAKDLGETINNNMPSIEKFIKIWVCYFKHSLQNPVVFSILFNQYGNNPLTFLKEYYEIFPDEEAELPEDVRETFYEADFDLRNRIILNKCAKEGLLQKEDINSIVDMSQFVFEGTLQNAKKEPENYTMQVFVKYLKHVLISFNPELVSMLNKITV